MQKNSLFRLNNSVATELVRKICAFYQIHLLLGAVALNTLPLAGATWQRRPYFRDVRRGCCCRAWGERKRRTKRDTTRLVGSRAECKGRVCPPVPCEHWFLLAEPVWDAASGVCPRGSAHHPSEACITQLQHSALISPFSCSPSVLWGKFLRDASSYSFNPLSSLNSIKLGLMKASSDLLIKNCFHRTDFCLQPVFSSCVDTWNFWLRILTTVVSGNGSCPSPQKCWLSSSKF